VNLLVDEFKEIGNNFKQVKEFINKYEIKDDLRKIKQRRTK
jgi:hypothetical protein